MRIPPSATIFEMGNRLGVVVLVERRRLPRFKDHDDDFRGLREGAVHNEIVRVRGEAVALEVLRLEHILRARRILRHDDPGEEERGCCQRERGEYQQPAAEMTGYGALRGRGEMFVVWAGFIM